MALSNERRETREAIEEAKDGLDEQELRGECAYNAKRLYDELQERGIQCHIVRGACEYPGEATPEDLEETRQMGLLHWWVEARVERVWMTVDLCSEDTNSMGETLFQNNRPTPYIPFDINPDVADEYAER